jgi:hypothetical protein
MFSKLFTLAAVAAVAYAQDENTNAAFDVEAGVQAASNAVNNLAIRTSAVERAVSGVAKGLVTAEKSMRRVAPLTDAANSLVEDVDAINHTMVTQLVDRKASLIAKLSTTRESLDAKLKKSLADIKAKMDAQNEAINAELADRIKAVEAQVSTVVEDAKPVGTFTAAHDKCTADGNVLVPGKGCKEAAIGETAHNGKVFWGGWSNEDGRDSGWVDGRFVKFTKKEDDTYIRVFYFDSLRTHGHNPHGRWNVMFCNANGDNCAHCSDPGRIQNWRYGYHQHSLWSWDAMPSRTFGLCKKSENTDMKKGDYSLKIYIESNHYDLSTGYNMNGNFMVDEVVKY